MNEKKTKDELLTVATEIKRATTKGVNTANKVGGLLCDMINSMDPSEIKQIYYDIIPNPSVLQFNIDKSTNSAVPESINLICKILKRDGSKTTKYVYDLLSGKWIDKNLELEELNYQLKYKLKRFGNPNDLNIEEILYTGPINIKAEEESENLKVVSIELFLVYESNIIQQLNVPVLRSTTGATGAQGKDGEPAVRISLDNEMDSIPCDANGITQLEIILSTVARIYKGATPISTGADVTSVGNINNFPGKVNGLDPPIHNITDGMATIKWTIPTNSTFTGKKYNATIEIKVNEVPYIATFTVNIVKAALPGVSPVIRQLNPNPALILFKSGETNNKYLELQIKQIIGNIVLFQNVEESGLIVKYSFTEMPNTMDDGNDWSDRLIVSPTRKTIYLAAFDPTDNNHYLIDKETIPVLCDGKDGLDGIPGTTPTITIDNNGYWVINGTATTVKAKGEDGTTPTVTINDDGYWVINGEVTTVKASGNNAVQLTLDNQHEDFLYSDSGIVSPVNGATSLAYLYEGSTDITGSVTLWEINDTPIDTNWSTSVNTNAIASISSSGLLTITGLKLDTVDITVRAKFNDKYYYAKFTANKTSQDKYDLIVAPNAIAYNPATYLTVTLNISAKRTNLQGNQTNVTINTTEYEGSICLYKGLVGDDGTISNVSLETNTSISIPSSDIITASGIYFELRKLIAQDTTTEAWTYHLLDYETVEIAKSLNGELGIQGPQGPQGDPGPQGPQGPKGDSGTVTRFYYYAGNWNSIDKDVNPLIVNDLLCPFVYDSTSSENEGYYVCMSLVYTEDLYIPSPANGNSLWEKMEDFTSIYSDVIISKFAKLGSFVINGDWMISQKGTLGLDNNNTEYTKFDPNYPNKTIDTHHNVNGVEWDGYNFVPNFAVDGKTGISYLNKAYITEGIFVDKVSKIVSQTWTSGAHGSGPDITPNTYYYLYNVEEGNLLFEKEVGSETEFPHLLRKYFSVGSLSLKSNYFYVLASGANDSGETYYTPTGLLHIMLPPPQHCIGQTIIITNKSTGFPSGSLLLELEYVRYHPHNFQKYEPYVCMTEQTLVKDHPNYINPSSPGDPFKDGEPVLGDGSSWTVEEEKVYTISGGNHHINGIWLISENGYPNTITSLDLDKYEWIELVAVEWNYKLVSGQNINPNITKAHFSEFNTQWMVTRWKEKSN